MSKDVVSLIYGVKYNLVSLYLSIYCILYLYAGLGSVVLGSFFNSIEKPNRGCDVEVIAKGIGLDKRIAQYFLKAGLGFGGSCLPKDTLAITYYARNLGEPLTIIERAINVNRERISRVLKMARDLIGELRGKRIAVPGLAFKEGTGDVRENQVLKLVKSLKEEGAIVGAYDPMALENALKVLDFIPAGSLEECIRKCDLVIIATGWSEFKEKINEEILLKSGVKVLIDARRVLDPKVFKTVKFRAVGLYAT